MAQLKCKKCGEPLEPGWDVCPVCETPVAEETKCTNCGKTLQPQWATCPYCGTPVNQPLYCSNCHAKLEPGWIVCPACNTPVKGNNIVNQKSPQINSNNKKIGDIIKKKKILEIMAMLKSIDNFV